MVEAWQEGPAQASRGATAAQLTAQGQAAARGTGGGAVVLVVYVGKAASQLCEKKGKDLPAARLLLSGERGSSDN